MKLEGFGEIGEEDRLDDSDMPEGATSVRMGSAVLQAIEEKEHYGLYRPIVIVRKVDGKITRERLNDMLGPLAVYRIRKNGDPRPADVGSLAGMITSFDHEKKVPLELILVWRPPPKDEG
ncbi:MAG: hypothetical protein AB7V46_11775 [Thermomicrobiales bacterium]